MSRSCAIWNAFVPERAQLATANLRYCLPKTSNPMFLWEFINCQNRGLSHGYMTPRFFDTEVG